MFNVVVAAGIRRTTTTSVLALGLCGLAHAAEGNFRVTAYVPPRGGDVVTQRDRMTMPDGAVRLTRNAGADSYAFSGTADDAARAYRAAMVRNGFHLVAERDGVQSWDDGRQRIELRLHPVIGTPATTRIVLIAQWSPGGG